LTLVDTTHSITTLTNQADSMTICQDHYFLLDKFPILAISETSTVNNTTFDLSSLIKSTLELPFTSLANSISETQGDFNFFLNV